MIVHTLLASSVFMQNNVRSLSFVEVPRWSIGAVIARTGVSLPFGHAEQPHFDLCRLPAVPLFSVGIVRILPLHYDSECSVPQSEVGIDAVLWKVKSEENEN
jgi:hypothetical protein